MVAVPGLLFWLFVLRPLWRVLGQLDPSTDKLCVDDECSTLMYRGEALDFTGPNCHFVNFKKGDPAYVYYKLARGSPEVWAGSVGHLFGYFPKDLIQVVHEYTKEELQVPTDEMDFVCFHGGRDDFDNYNVEELLEFLELYNSATGDSEKDVEKNPELSKEREPEPDSVEANSVESDRVFSEKAKDLQEEFTAQKHHPHTNSQADHAQGEQPSFEASEEMLPDKLKVPEGENNKTSNSSQVSNEQDKIDGYKLLKKEMTLDLKTKFGSTADALVSDDERTRLVTSLEDDFDEDLDAEYYAVGKEDEDNQKDFDKLPLLTFIDGEDIKNPAKSGVEKYSTDKKQNSNEEDKVELTVHADIKNDDKNILTTWMDTIYSLDTGGKEKTDTLDLESSNSEEEKDDDALVPDSKQGKSRSATDYSNPDNVDDGLLIVDIPKMNNDKGPEVNTECHIKGKGQEVQESKKCLVQDETELEDEKQERMTVYSPTHSNNLNSMPAGEKGKDTLKSALDNKEIDLNGAGIHISKGMPHEEKPGEPILEGGSESESAQKAAGNAMNAREIQQESLCTAPVMGDNHPNTSRDGVEGDASVNGTKPHTLPVEHQCEGFKEELVLKTQNQPTSSSPDEIGLPRERKEKATILGRNLSWQRERYVAAAVNKQISEKIRLSEGEAKEDSSDEEVFHHKAIQHTEEVGQTNQSDSTGEPALLSEAEEDDYPPEELLEDENAVSAKWSKEENPGIQGRQFDVNLQVPERAVLGTTNPDPETEESKRETGKILDSEKKCETAAKGFNTGGREPYTVVGKECPAADEKAHRPSKESDFSDSIKTQTPELAEALQKKDSDYLKNNNPEEHLKTSGLAEKPEGELIKEDHENTEKYMGTESQGSATVDLENDSFLWTPHTTVEPEYSDKREDLPIRSSFFKEQQSLRRFQKYFNVHKLESLLQEMSSKLKSAQQETLPYNVEKVLDKVFHASVSQILSIAEKMLDTRVAENRDLGMKENNIFPEAAVLDDIQDLIYFVRHKHSAAEETAILVMAPPLDEGLGGVMEELQPPLEDNVSQESTAELSVQAPEESTHLDQPVMRDTHASEVSLKPNTEKDLDPGQITTEYPPMDGVEANKQLEMVAEETASVTPLENAILLICSFTFYLTKLLVSTLPDDVQPTPDFYGLPWKPVLITAFLGIASVAVFFWRTILVAKSRVYQVTEQQISEKVKIIVKENTELVQKLSNYEQKIEESKKHIQETRKQNMILSDKAIKFKDKIKTLEKNNEILGDRAKNLRVMLESEREQNVKNQDLISENKSSIEKLKHDISMNASEFSEIQIALNEAKLSEEKVKSECHQVQEENARLKKKKEQLQQEIEDWRKLHAELSEQIKSFEKSQKDLEVALTHKDDNINALTNCITQLNQLECESESEGQNKGGNDSDELANGEVADNISDRNEKMKNQIKQMMDVSRTQTAISVVEEDLKCLQVKLKASMSTKCNLEDQIKKLEDDRNSLQSAKDGREDEYRTLRQKVEILNELYQQKEMALQKKLSQEEYELQEREQRLSAADEKAGSAAEEVKTYKRRIEEMENELQKTERLFKNQIATHEKKAHENWLKARAAERAIAEEKSEATNLRHKLLELTEKMAMLREEPVILKPMPGRRNTQNCPERGPLSQNGSFGPPPVSGGECCPPLTVEPPVRPLAATLSRRDMPRSEFGSVDGPLSHHQWSAEAPGKPSPSDPGSGTAAMMNNSSRGSSPTMVMDEGKVNRTPKGPPPFPGVPLMSTPMGGPVPPPTPYGPPPQLCGPFGPRPIPPPFGPGMRPPLGLREFAPGKRDLPLHPREFLPGHAPFRPLGPLGPREYFIPGIRLPPPTHVPQDYPPPAPGSRDEPPPASQSTSQDCSPALKQSP
uniref:Transport and Golgi organization protein 1 homolog n=1 Tax=Saimiri boliviensis boliviensis TaxID=39432 RepID=A0A2K6S6C0_SAIBB